MFSFDGFMFNAPFEFVDEIPFPFIATLSISILPVIATSPVIVCPIVVIADATATTPVPFAEMFELAFEAFVEV